MRSDIFGEMKEKKVVIYGVGSQTSLINNVINRGAEVVAIDVSSEAVRRIRD